MTVPTLPCMASSVGADQETAATPLSSPDLFRGHDGVANGHGVLLVLRIERHGRPSLDLAAGLMSSGW